MKKTILLLFIIHCTLFMVFAQQPTLEWVSRFHMTYSHSYSVTSDNLGNIFVSGYYNDYNINKTSFLTLKYNTLGILIWSSLYRGPDTLTLGATDIAYKCLADGTGNVYVAGESNNNTNGEDILVIKYNTEGDTVWIVRFDGQANSADHFADMVIDKYANIYITGYSFNFPVTGQDYVTIKYDSAGNKIWEAYYNNIYNSPDHATAIAIDSSQNVYITGYCGNAYLFYEYVTVKYNQSGIQQWVSKYTKQRDAEAVSIAVDRNKNVYVTGYIDILPPEFKNYITIKYDSSGNELWKKEFRKVFPTEATDIPYKILLDSSSNVYISGTSIVKYNSDGIFQWADSTAPGKYPALDNNGNLYVTGPGSTPAPNQFNWIQTVKYNNNGGRIWTLIYGRRQDTVATPSDILVDRENNIYLTGNVSVINHQNSDSILLFKYSQPIGIWGNSNEAPLKFILYQNYPNPFNTITIIRYELPKPGKVKISFFSTLGQEIKTLVYERQTQGFYSISFDMDNFSSGVYFYSLFIDDVRIDTKKMILLK